MAEPIRILIVEDLPTDAELAEREIKKVLGSCLFRRVETRSDYLAALEEFQPDLIVSDYRMPHFDGLTALKLVLERNPLTPFIILTGAINEDTAVECMKAGAADYVIKEHIKRLGQAVIHALEEKQVRQKRHCAEKALRESEERFRSLYENATIGLYRTTPAGQILMANPAAVQMLGFNSFDELARRNLEREGFDAVPRSRFRHKVERDGIVTGLESTWLRKDGSTIFVRESARAVQDENGQVLYYDGTFEDITERKELEEQLRQAQKMESIGRLAGGVAHDFNNLLTVIQGYCDFMDAQIPAQDPLRKELVQIQRAGERAAALTRQLLAFSRRQTLTPIVLDLNSLVTNLRKMLERLIGEDVVLKFDLRPDLWSITADPGQIEQVIMNLIVNARDAMPTGGALTIQTDNVLLDENCTEPTVDTVVGPCVMLAITDTGQGMDKQTLTQIFEPFFTTKDAEHGTGLGLATVYGIVKQSGGNITVFSRPGQGAIFKIFLPANESSSNDLGSVGAHTRTQPAILGGSETILLAEDEDVVRDLVQTVLVNMGYTVLEAGHGHEALSLAEQYGDAIDLLVTDVVMPHISGRELAMRLRALRPQMKVLFITGHTDDALIRHGLLPAEVELLPKPLSPSKLIAKVREVLDK